MITITEAEVEQAATYPGFLLSVGRLPMVRMLKWDALLPGLMSGRYR